jgi:hypothetical protein
MGPIALRECILSKGGSVYGGWEYLCGIERVDFLVLFGNY